MTNIDDVMNMSWDDIPDEKTPPEGEYILRMTGYYADNLPNDKGTPFVDFRFVVTTILNAPEAKESEIPHFKQVYDREWTSTAALPYLKKTLVRFFGANLAGMGIDESFETLVGTEVRAIVAQERWTDKAGNEQSRAIVKRYLRPQG